MVFGRHRKAEASLEDERARLVQLLDAARSYEGTTEGCPVVLRGSERMLASVSGVALVEPRRGKGHWEGRTQGVSVHVPGTRSMRYRIGASKGTFVQGEERPTAIDTGTFTLTTSRAVFAGEKQTREWAWSKLISVTHASDAPWTALAVSNRQRTSGVAYDAGHAELIRFWIDLAVAIATDTRSALVAELEAAVAATDPRPPDPPQVLPPPPPPPPPPPSEA